MIMFSGVKSHPLAVMQNAIKYLLSFSLALTPLLMNAQSSASLFQGTWQVQTPEKGALVIVLKSQGIASYFWGDNTDRTVYSGSWTGTDTSVSITWTDGSSHAIERSDVGLTATYQEASGGISYTVPAMQLPQEMLGQWAKPPTREDEMRSDRDEAKGYFGIWKLADSEDFLFIQADRSAASNRGTAAGQRGEWAKQGSELHIIWDSGEYGILRETERGYNYKQVELGQIIEDDKTKAVAATRTIESSVPADWFADYKAAHEKDSGGLAFTSSKVARAFYRGNWLVRRAEKSYERIELARFGGLKTSKDRSLEGQWTLSGQDVFMRWDDGVRRVLSPVGRGFVLYEYKPGRPLDGVPTRILPAAPEDTAKLAEHLKGRENVAEQMKQMAVAAGIDPISQEDAGWGRTFARWAWPFGDEGDVSADAMLTQEFEPEEASEPWWWPFWSENADQDKVSSETTNDGTAEDTAEGAEPAPVPVELIEVEVDETNNAQANSDGETPEKKSKRPGSSINRYAKEWLWPF